MIRPKNEVEQVAVEVTVLNALCNAEKALKKR